MLHLKAAQPGDDGRGRLGIDVAKGAASERGEAEPEDRSQVAVAGRGEDAFVEAVRGLVDHQQGQPVLDRRGVERLAPGVAEERVDRLVGTFLFGLAPLAVVRVEALAALLAQRACLGQRLGRRADVEVAPGGVAAHHLGDLARHVDADEVEEFVRPHRKAKARHGLVDLLDPGAFAEQQQRLVHVEAQDARGVQPRPGAHDDDRLALPQPRLVDRRQHPVGRLVGLDDFEQGHLRHGREVVHPDDHLGPRRRLGNLGNRNRGGVGGEDAVGARDGFGVGEDGPF